MDVIVSITNSFMIMTCLSFTIKNIHLHVYQSNTRLLHWHYNHTTTIIFTACARIYTLFYLRFAYVTTEKVRITGYGGVFSRLIPNHNIYWNVINLLVNVVLEIKRFFSQYVCFILTAILRQNYKMRFLR